MVMTDPLMLVQMVRQIGGTPASSRRLAYWLPATEFRVVCANGHIFSPHSRVDHGRGRQHCRRNQGSKDQCDSILYEIVTGEPYPRRLLAEVTREEWEWIKGQRMDPESEIAYLVNEQVRQ
jgi:hypothetical protein